MNLTEQHAEENDEMIIDDDQENSGSEVSESDSADRQNSVESDNQSTEEHDEEVIVSIGGSEEESPPVSAPGWVKELRKSNREKERRIRELEAKLATSAPETKPVQLGAKPRLEDHDYDTEKFEQALDSWHERKRQIDLETERVRQSEQAQQKLWQDKLDGYSKAKAELKVRDYEDAEAIAQEVFSVTQQGIILQGAENPALLVYALGKNPKKSSDLSKITDPVQFAFAVARLEKELKVTNRKAAPAPERVIQGTGRASGAVDSTLERLREEAARTGNMTKVIQYRQQKRLASK